MISTNYAYHKLIDKHRWMEEMVIKIWSFHKHIKSWRFHVIEASWSSRLMLRVKYSFGELWLELYYWGNALTKRNVATRMCFFCLAELEHSTH